MKSAAYTTKGGLRKSIDRKLMHSNADLGEDITKMKSPRMQRRKSKHQQSRGMSKLNSMEDLNLDATVFSPSKMQQMSH